MGEIADALRKANEERDRARQSAPSPPARDAEQHADEVARGWATEAPSPAARPPTVPPVPTPAPGPTPALDPRPAADLPHEATPQPASRPGSAEHGADEFPPIHLDGTAPNVDHARHLALRLKSEMDRRTARSVLVASALRNEGKTTVSCNLAIALASVSSGRGIALVDFDLRNPSIGRRLGIDAQTGIDEAILGQIPLADACHPMSAPRIDVYPTSKPRPNAHELLVGDGFQRVMQELHARYEIVVIDSPPTLLVPDTTLVLRHADACVTVAHSGVTRVRMFRKMISMLPPEQILGKILNAASTEKHQRDYYAYGYGYGPDEDETTTSEGGAS